MIRMEWLGVLLLYLISGFLKKREQNKKQREIESDPNWDEENNLAEEESPDNFGQLLNDLFEQNPKIPEANPIVKDVIGSESNTLLDESDQNNEPIEKDIFPKDDVTIIEDQLEEFEDNIYHSKLAEREALHYGNKWLRRVNLKEELFRTKRSLRRSIIIKEILDKPIGMRD